MGPLPVGTLTLLFSDIEGSTSMLAGLGTRWGEALSAQRSILRSVFEDHHGIEMGTEGDSFFVVFTSAQQAVMAAVESHRQLQAHDWPAGVPLKVRIGIHTGEPQRHEDGYIGMDVHRAARIQATASGGQTVVSAATQALLGGLPDDVSLRDLGWHRLKDIPEQQQLFDVVVPDLPQDHPPLRSLGTSANLPSHATPLLGREHEIAELTEAMSAGEARLVTLTGPGGTGKTRLAVAVAGDLQRRSPCDIFFVPLHTADRAALMWSGIAEAVGAPADTEQLPVERALSFLRDRRACLVLDNLEQIVDADVVVSQLLTEAPQVIVLATSRRPLHLVDEHQYPVSTLTLPDADDVTLEEAQASAAVGLFVQRARMVKPAFQLTSQNVADVVTLCRWLDGLPLAIELTAARSRLLSPRALLKRLDDRLGDASVTTRRPSRQQTLNGTIAWSYDLLDREDREVFRRLGVFAGRVDLDAVEQVAATDERDPLDVVAHLVDVSLVEIVEGPDGDPTVWMLETIRRFARERLQAEDAEDEVRLRHLKWCVSVGEEATKLLDGPIQMTALDRISAVEEDIRAALDWCLTTGAQHQDRLMLGLSMLKHMNSYWYRFGYVAEGRGWHERALAVIDSTDIMDSPGVVDALHGEGVLAVQQNDLMTGTPVLERSLAMAERLGDLDLVSRECNSLAIARREAGDIEGARILLERSLTLARQVGSLTREAAAQSNMVHLHMDRGDYAAAVQAAHQGIAVDQARNDPWGIAVNRANLAPALLNAEGPEAAYALLAESIRASVALGDVELSIDLIESFAAVWAGLGDPARAALLLGAAENHREIAEMPRPAPDQRLLDPFVRPAQAALGQDAWESAYRTGRSLSIDEAVDEALAESPAKPTVGVGGEIP